MNSVEPQPGCSKHPLLAAESWPLDVSKERLVRVDRVRTCDGAKPVEGGPWRSEGAENFYSGPMDPSRPEWYVEVRAGVEPENGLAR